MKLFKVPFEGNGVVLVYAKGPLSARDAAVELLEDEDRYGLQFDSAAFEPGIPVEGVDLDDITVTPENVKHIADAIIPYLDAD